MGEARKEETGDTRRVVRCRLFRRRDARLQRGDFSRTIAVVMISGAISKITTRLRVNTCQSLFLAVICAKYLSLSQIILVIIIVTIIIVISKIKHNFKKYIINVINCKIKFKKT